jgi:hypothetical protein
MKTTLDLQNTLLARARIMAAQQNTSLTRLIEEGLRLRLQTSVARTRSRRALPVFHGKGGLAAGLTGRSNQALLDAADA